MPRLRGLLRATLAAALERRRLFWSADAERPDRNLTELAGELAANEPRLRALLAGDGRDTEDIPGFDALADRQREIVEQLCRLPARGVEGLVAKARGIRLRDPAMGYDGAAVLGWSLGGDVVRLFDPSA